MTRVFAISDIHIDYEDNMDYMLGLSAVDYVDDVLIIAGDVTDKLEKMEALFSSLAGKFRDIFFVPGNHDLWVRFKEYPHSIDKFEALLSLCQSYQILTTPKHYEEEQFSIVPLFSWYIKHDEGDGSLYIPKKGEDKSLSMWSDNYHALWPLHLANSGLVNQYFLQLNEVYLSAEYIQQNMMSHVISFSHFLPRTDLMLSSANERAAIIEKLGTEFIDPYPAFNFSSVAGSSTLDEQIRRLGSDIHIYGHQHRNRDRVVDGVQYISNCLGYPRERSKIKELFGSVSASMIKIWG